MNPAQNRKNVLVIVTGSRDWTNEGLVFDRLNAAERYADFLVVLEGGARGADRAAMKWGSRRRHHGKVGWLQFKADWNAHGKRAGTLRNEWMLQYAVDAREKLKYEVYCLAFPLPQSVGTRHMMKICREAGIPVWSP